MDSRIIAVVMLLQGWMGLNTGTLRPDICMPLGCGFEEGEGGVRVDQIRVPVPLCSLGCARVVRAFVLSNLDISKKYLP